MKQTRTGITKLGLFSSLFSVLVPLSTVATVGCVGQIGVAGTSQVGNPPGTGGPGAIDPATGAGGAGTDPSGPVVDPGAPPVDFTKPPVPSSEPTAFACDANKVAPSVPLRRLSAASYRNTVKDVVSLLLKKNASEALAVYSEIESAVNSLPEDERVHAGGDERGSFRRLDQALDQVQVEGFYEVATAAGVALTKGARLGTLAGTCATDADKGNDGTCAESFIKSVGERILRAPVTAADVTFYKKFFDLNAGAFGAAQGFADLITGLLASPSFAYFVESGGAAVAGKANVVTLTPYELASRLSYHFWQTMPDDALWESAKSGALATKTGLETQIARLWADGRTRTTVDDFFREYLKLEDLGALSDLNETPSFKKFAGSDLPTKSLRQNMIDEVLAMSRYYTLEAPAPLETLFTSDSSFARTDDLAKLYDGVAKWTPGQTPPSFPAGQRPGVLTRAAVLASGLATTRPIQKGTFIRRSILCDELPPPPAGVNASPPALDPKLTQRQVVEGLTEQKSTVCAGCHTSFINHLGYPTEQYDALGRRRQMERLITLDGQEVGSAPIVTHAVPQVDTGDMTPVESPLELMNALVKSGKPQACFARNYFRFTFARFEKAEDNCALERVRQSLMKGGSIGATLREMPLAPEFQQRSFD